MATNLFNGKVFISQTIKLGNLWQITLNFTDLNNHFKGSDVRQGDVLFCRGVMGESIRAVIQTVDLANFSTIICKILTDEIVNFIPLSNGALVRETTNRKYPMFPNGISESLRSIMLSYYAWLSDRDIAIVNSLDLLSLNEINDNIIIRLQQQNIDGTYSEKGTLLGTLARYIRQIEEGSEWKDKLGYINEENSIISTYNGDGTPETFLN